MPSRLEKQGRCLCGAVELTISLQERCVSACHCRMCRTWGGGPLLVVHSDMPPRFNLGKGVWHIRLGRARILHGLWKPSVLSP
ncbi:hypothetical protein IQ22_03883 [Pseudomonas duriflava]|uniref:CENP-V/GFA domain-containing protein n=1 Tax=Pseudomonas duriflava TaxID=459528 RepID=A0A562Q1D1_9PSED|nr:hypothetical protein IQ22_03883 [Pseudomonas duriflava]